MHAFLFLQAAHQYHNLHEIGDLLRRSLITVEMLKTYISNVRRASYPDAARFRQERTDIEAAWPEYKKEFDLCRPPQTKTISGLCPVDTIRQKSESWIIEGEQCKKAYNGRLQPVMSRMKSMKRRVNGAHCIPAAKRAHERFVKVAFLSKMK